VALQIAREGMVLLKNDSNLLPISRGSIKSIAVIGPNAHPAVPVGGGSAAVKPIRAVSFFEGFTNALAQSAAVYTHRGIPDWSELANATFFSTGASGRQAGIKVEIFHNKDLSETPAIRRVDQHIDASLSGNDEGSSVRWSGFYHANAAGLYRAFVQSASDGACVFRLYVDNELVIDDWSLRKAAIDHANVQLQAGAHKFVFERYQSGVNFSGNPVRVGIAPAESLVDPGAKALAAESDLVVLAVGYDNESETEGSDRTFGLPIGQDELIREIAALNKRTVVVVTSGGGVDMTSWLDRVPALIQAWYPGQEGGAAFAEIVLGDVNPSGRLPVSFETRWEDNPSYESYYPEAAGSQVIYRSGVFMGYRGYERNGTRPLFPFGYGLSYTSFRYSSLTIKPLDDAASYEVSFDVSNTGKREGAEVAQVYVGDAHASVPRPPKELKGFAKVTLQPGETGTVRIKLDARSFAWFDAAGQQWKAEPGDFDVLVGPSSAQIELRDKITLRVPVTISILTAIA
jgi:beta-glucosidase